MGYEEAEQLDDLIRIATRLRSRIEDSKDRTYSLGVELARLEALIAVKVAALKAAGASDAEVR